MILIHCSKCTNREALEVDMEVNVMVYWNLDLGEKVSNGHFKSVVVREADIDYHRKGTGSDHRSDARL